MVEFQLPPSLGLSLPAVIVNLILWICLENEEKTYEREHRNNSVFTASKKSDHVNSSVSVLQPVNVILLLSSENCYERGVGAQGYIAQIYL